MEEVNGSIMPAATNLKNMTYKKKTATMATSHLEPTTECDVCKNISQKGQYGVVRKV